MLLINIDEKIKNFINSCLRVPTLEKTKDGLHYYMYFKTFRCEVHVLKYEDKKDCSILFQGFLEKNNEKIKYFFTSNYNYIEEENNLKQFIKDLDLLYNRMLNFDIMFN